MEKIDITSQKPIIPSCLHWYNSSNILCNYMREVDYLKLILDNQAIIPRYVIEPLDYLSIPKLERIAFPMTCFCDIPFSRAIHHMTNYGTYGIAFNKQTLIEKAHVQPIHYINVASPLARDFKSQLSYYLHPSDRVSKEYEPLVSFLLSYLLYIKPISGYNDSLADIYETYVYQDECEWRFVPTENFPDDFKLVLPQSQTNKNACNVYSAALRSHPETWLHFDWEDVQYIIVPDELARKEIIHKIRSLNNLKDDEKFLLTAKIEISNRFSEDLT